MGGKNIYKNADNLESRTTGGGHEAESTELTLLNSNGQRTEENATGVSVLVDTLFFEHVSLDKMKTFLHLRLR